MVDAGRLAGLFEHVSSLPAQEREAFVVRVRDEDPELGASLAALLDPPHGTPPVELGSFARRLRELYGPGADPRISLENESGASNFGSGIVRRLAGRGERCGRYTLDGQIATAVDLGRPV